MSVSGPRRVEQSYRISLITGGIAALLAGFIPLEELAELVNIGTLFAFVVVSIGVVILRRTRNLRGRPDRRPRPECAPRPHPDFDVVASET